MNDKLKHQIAGTIIVMITILICKYGLDIRILWSGLIGFAVGSIVGVLKEYVWDKYLGKGTFSYADILATIWGALCGSILLMAILNTIK